MRSIWSNRSFVAACALVLLSIAPITCLMGWSFFGNLDPVSMPVPVRPGNYSSPWFTTRVNDLYELDLGTTPWRRNPVDLNWQVIDASGNILATGNWHDKTSGTTHITLARYRPKPGLRQRVLINIPHDVARSEPVTTLSLYCPEASLDFSYEAPVAILWAIFFLGLAVFFVIAFVPRFLHSSRRPTFLTFTFQRLMTNFPFSRMIMSFHGAPSSGGKVSVRLGDYSAIWLLPRR